MQEYLLHIDTALLTRRTVVRRFREQEGNDLYILIQENTSHIIDHFPLTLKEIKDQVKAEIYIRRKFSAWLLQREYCFGIWDTNSAKLIGFVRIFGIDWNVPKAEIGFFIDHKHTQRGLMTEAMISLLSFAFQQLKLEKLILRTATDNYPTQRLARKCGFRREGDLRSDFKRLTTGELVDVMYFGFTRHEYEKI